MVGTAVPVAVEAPTIVALPPAGNRTNVTPVVIGTVANPSPVYPPVVVGSAAPPPPPPTAYPPMSTQNPTVHGGTLPPMAFKISRYDINTIAPSSKNHSAIIKRTDFLSYSYVENQHRLRVLIANKSL